MNNNTFKLKITELGGITFGLILSVVFHFAYEWAGSSPSVAWLFAINESIWEHGKLVFYPYLIYSIIEYFILKPDKGSFITAKSISLLTAIPLMLVMYYTYSGIIGANVMWVDISIAVIVVLLNYLFSYIMMSKNYRIKNYKWLLVPVFIVLVMVIVFTYYPPNIALFIDFSV